MQQREIDIHKSLERRDQGMASSAEHANAEESEWTGQALGFLTMYAGQHKGAGFLIEEARTWAEARGLPEPPDARAWGAVTKRAQAKGRIEKAGSACAASSNMALKTTWRAGPRFAIAPDPAEALDVVAAAERDVVELEARRARSWGIVQTIKGIDYPEALATLRVRNGNGEDVGSFAQVVPSFVCNYRETLIQAAARSLPADLCAYFPDEAGAGSAIEIQGVGPTTEEQKA